MAREVDVLQKVTSIHEAFRAEAAKFQRNFEISRGIAKEGFVRKSEVFEARTQLRNAMQKLHLLREEINRHHREVEARWGRF